METKCALFIDFNNFILSMKDAFNEKTDEECLNILLKIITNMREKESNMLILSRAYADWETWGHIPAQSSLMLINVEPRFVLDKPGKSSADIKLSLEALEILLTRSEIEKFIIIGGDRDYIPMVSRIKEGMKEVEVYGFKNISLSGDLAAIVGGDENVKNVVEMVEEMAKGSESVKVEEKVEEKVVEGKGKEKKKKKKAEEKISAPNDKFYLGPDYLSRTIKQILDAEQKYKGEIWLSPFLKNYMNTKFETLNDEQRKEIITYLSEKGAININKEDSNWGYSYSVFSVNHDHELVRKAKGEG
ncbi:MAG: NYN domain-containing protein [Deltaproteobacteria bacterium]|nr:MAG: NYN domain-containing protein [Deltaproteobacteria bacterium]